MHIHGIWPYRCARHGYFIDTVAFKTHTHTHERTIIHQRERERKCRCAAKGEPYRLYRHKGNIVKETRNRKRSKTQIKRRENIKMRKKKEEAANYDEKSS